jgi:signal transduction histidine kinase
MSEFGQGFAAQPARSSPDAVPQDTAAVVRHVAHELRQPLSTIESIAYYLGMVLPHTESKARLQVTKLQEQIRQINWILADAIHFLQASPPHLQLLDLGEVVSRSLAEWAQTEGLEARLDLGADLPLVRLDLVQLEHLLHNLLFFFRRVCGLGELVTVSTSAAPEEVRLQVSSAAGGIDTGDLASLFEPFRPHQPSGSGLALASVRRIADAHGARIEVQSDPGDALSVTVAFPLAAAPPSGQSFSRTNCASSAET